MNSSRWLALTLLLTVGFGCMPKDRVQFTRNQFEPGDVTLAFNIFDLEQQELTADDLAIAHEKLLHLIVVREDMQGYQHLHPDYTDGAWTVDTSFPEQGTYLTYVDIDPKAGDPEVLKQTVTVGKALSLHFPSITENFTSASGGLTSTLVADGLMAGMPHTLSFFVRENGTAPTIDPYLGAYGHVVALKHNDSSVYVHAHPITEETPTDGRVQFEITFPSKGTYTLFPQFNIDGTVHTFPITVDVADGGDHVAPSGGHGGHH